MTRHQAPQPHRRRTTEARPLVVGLGNRDRGDDGVGVVVAARVAALAPQAVRVIVTADPTELVDLFPRAGTVVVVDALHTGVEPGTVRVLDASAEALPTTQGTHSSHAVGLASAVELARALGRLPARLVVVGVEAGQCQLGTGLSAAVAGTVDAAAHHVLVACGRPADPMTTGV